MFKCEYCGKQFVQLEDRTKCELTCNKEIKERTKREEQVKKEKENEQKMQKKRADEEKIKKIDSEIADIKKSLSEKELYRKCLLDEYKEKYGENTQKNIYWNDIPDFSKFFQSGGKNEKDKKSEYIRGHKVKTISLEDLLKDNDIVNNFLDELFKTLNKDSDKR